MPDDTVRTSMPDPTVQTPAPDDDRTPPSGIPVQQAPAGWPTTPYQGLQQQQPLPQPPPPTPPRRRRKVGLVLLAIGVVVVLLIAVHTIVQNLSDSGAYDDGHQAYQKADCRAAIAQFDEALDSWQVIEFGDSVQRAQAEKDECLLFQNAVDNEAGNGSAALIAYADFVPGRPASPLTEATRGRVAELFKADVSKLASVDSCGKLQALRDNRLLPDTGAAPFYAACGSTFAKAGDENKALTVYKELFVAYGGDKAATDAEAEMLKDSRWCDDLDKFRNESTLRGRKDLLPGLLSTCAKQTKTDLQERIALAEEFLKTFQGHRFTGEVTATLAQLLNEDVRSGRATDFGQAEETGVPGGDNAVILVFNDSPETLRVALSGPNSAIEELPGCPACPREATSGGICREQFATQKRIVVQPGLYDVAFDFPGVDKVTGGYGKWALEPGKAYFQCISIGPAG